MIFETNREIVLLLIGVLIGMVISVPIIMINPATSPPDGYDTIIIENKFEYNLLYSNYLGVVGSAIDGDVSLQVEFNLTDSTYRNVGVLLVGDENIHIYALCFYNNERITIYENMQPEINNWYTMESVEDLLGVIVFYHREAESVLQISTWVW